MTETFMLSYECSALFQKLLCICGQAGSYRKEHTQKCLYGKLGYQNNAFHQHHRGRRDFKLMKRREKYDLVGKA